VDVINDPGGREAMLKLGVRNLPIVAKGDQYVLGQNLEDVAEFVGLQGTGHTPLPPPEIMRKWIKVLRAAQRYVRQLPAPTLQEPVIPNRPRSIRLMGHHIFRIPEAYLETVVDGAEYVAQAGSAPPADTQGNSGEDLARYGEDIIARLEQWWNALADKSCRQTIRTYYGEQRLHLLLERCAWHSAQHTRQLIAVLERLGLEPDQRLSSDDLAGLPLPERLWE